MADRSTAAVDVAKESGRSPLAAHADGATADGVTARKPGGAQADAEAGGAGAEGPGETATGTGGTSPDASGTSGTPGARVPADADAETVENAPSAPSAPSAADAGSGPSADTVAEPSVVIYDTDSGVLPATPDLHSGHKLARRYRLEECLTRTQGFSSWRAVDEKLRRAVGVHVLPAEHPRARSVLAAARSAALLGDPRFVQVLDAVEEKDLVWVVHEWLPDAVDLTAVLAAGPMEPYDAHRLVSQLSQAMAAAHREGLSHLCLHPGTVLRTESGQYRIRGLAVSAALLGKQSDTPQRDDTEAIGALLYAALTQRWPYPDDAHGLSGLPADIGMVAPDQVRAGVHRGLSELAMRALVHDGSASSRHEEPCTTPEELAKAVAALPKIRPPEPEVNPYRGSGYRQPPARGPHNAAPRPAPVPPPPPALPGRTGKALKWGVSALLIAALGLGSWQLAETVMNGRKGSQDSTETSSGATGGNSPKPSVPLDITSATEFSPLKGAMKPADAPKAVDGDDSSSWITLHFKGFANFGNLPDRGNGSGIVVDLGSVRKVTDVEAKMYLPGQTVEVLAAAPDASAPTALADFPERISQEQSVGKELKVSAAEPVETRYVLVRISALAPETTGQYRGGISEITVRGEGE
ncbi:protein kinase family protein [Streptomyces thermolineatus]|uniref:protein kinase family protein n=1 Tax=Streptomyces thermolineatus TaxID=44033 RepID=UPI00384FD055